MASRHRVTKKSGTPAPSGTCLKTRSTRATPFCRKAIPWTSLRKRKSGTAAKSRSIMWKGITRPSLRLLFLRRSSESLSGAAKGETGTAASTFSPEKSSADSAEAGTAQRSGTPQISTGRSSGSAITSLTTTSAAPHHTLPTMRSNSDHTA